MAKEPTQAKMFVLVKSHIGQALLPTKFDADYAVWPAECNVPNERSFYIYWLIVDFHAKPKTNIFMYWLFPDRKVLAIKITFLP